MQPQNDPAEDDTDRIQTVFSWCLQLATQYLEAKEGTFKVIYEQGLRWRDISLGLPQDLIVCAAAAKQRVGGGAPTRLDWLPCLQIEHPALSSHFRNTKLADNHAHYTASPDVVTAAWVGLMNNPKSQHKAINAKNWDEYLHPIVLPYHGQRVGSWSERIAWASAIRALLCYAIFKSRQEVHKALDDEAAWLHNHLMESLERVPQIALSVLRVGVGQLLNSLRLSIFGVGHMGAAAPHPDIAFGFVHGAGYSDNCEAWMALGERELIVSMMTAIFKGEAEVKAYENLFYAYVQLFCFFRKELVQSNDRVGFNNFFKYQKRKDDLIPNKKTQEIRKQLFLRDRVGDGALHQAALSGQNLRVPPKDNIKSLFTALNDINNICYPLRPLPFRDRFDALSPMAKQLQVVYHFIKEQSKDTERICPLRTLSPARNRLLRTKVKTQALVLGAFLSNHNLFDMVPPGRMRLFDLVSGIDSASNELLARNEVFAQAYRFLRSHPIPKANGGTRNLNIMTHAGEEFFDPADGLRYIDESIRFLELKRGDAIGHALALCTDIKAYYAAKGRRITMPRQDYFDNIVWMMGKAAENDIVVPTTIQIEFDTLRASLFASKADVLSFGHFIFYSAWKLRGDNPELYQDEHGIRRRGDFQDKWSCYALGNLGNEQHLRDNVNVNRCYHLYHYHDESKKAGEVACKQKISDAYIQLIEQLQAIMYKQIACLGLHIEMLPSVNVAITPSRKYADHPILKFAPIAPATAYPNFSHLTCIGTDNAGVVATSLENEHTLLMLALSKEKDLNGDLRYNEAELLKWMKSLAQNGRDLYELRQG